MPRYSAVITLLFMSLVLSGFSRASHPFRLQGLVMQDFIEAIQDYMNKYDVYPLNDQESSWFQKIHADTPKLFEYFGLTLDGRYPLDYYSNPFVYEPPSQANGNQIVIRSVGENGVDDLGALDDWDIRFGPNYGYWHTMNWPAAYRRAGICTVLAIAGLVFLWRRVKNTYEKVIWSFIWVGCLSRLAMPWGFDVYPFGGIDPGWIGTVYRAGLLPLVIGLFLGLLRLDYKRSKRRAKVAESRSKLQGKEEV